EHLLASAAFEMRRLRVVARELPLEQAVDATHLLFFAKAKTVLAELDPTLAVLAGRIRAPGNRAFFAEAALALEIELHAFAATKPANGTDVTCHLSDSFAPLKRAGASAGDNHCGERASRHGSA